MVFCVHKNWNELTSHDLVDGIPQDNDIVYRVVIGCWQEGRLRYFYVAIGVQDENQLPPPLHLSAQADEISGYFGNGWFADPELIPQVIGEQMPTIRHLCPKITIPMQSVLCQSLVTTMNYLEHARGSMRHHLGFTAIIDKEDPTLLRIRPFHEPVTYSAWNLMIMVLRVYSQVGLDTYYYEIGDGESMSFQSNRSQYIKEYHEQMTDLKSAVK